ncbi:MAG TPA: N-acetyltransferase [Desulfobacterales bacterium]|nr:N-acetyltransferase [Desulfobacterales bacterium]
MTMEYIEPPPAIKIDDKKLGRKLQKVPLHGKDESQIVIQKAQIRDVEEILELVNSFAASNLMLPRGPQYLYENIRDFIIADDRNIPIYSLTKTREVLHLIVACGSLHVLWEDIAEIRALAIHPDYQQMGLGSKLIEYMIEEAKQLGIRRLYTFTLTEDFFKTLGFKLQNRAELPPKVWGECSRCPKYFQCDEIGMVLKL